MQNYNELKEYLLQNQFTWLITGVAGFIGSNILEELLKLNQKVIGLDNFSTGYPQNLNDVMTSISSEEWKNFVMIEGDITNKSTVESACENVDHVLHQAALGSVPRSIENPIATNLSNVSGFLNVLNASYLANVKSFTYAASSSTYGDHTSLPKVEDVIGKPLSPYAITKYVNELYASIFFSCYGFPSVGLRYFNVFGKRQDPDGAYAAVIPKWINAMISQDEVTINGDGSTSRDFCYIDNAVQANILAATNISQNEAKIFNVAVGDRTSLNELFQILKSNLNQYQVIYDKEPKHLDFRAGDVMHSQASIKKIIDELGYSPQFNVSRGIKECIPWYIKNSQDSNN
jgi:UDP-N-acetylglucosamine 4-epimerase